MLQLGRFLSRTSRGLVPGVSLLLASTLALAQQTAEYKSLKLQGRPHRLDLAEPLQPFPLGSTLKVEGRLERPAAIEEAWTPSTYHVSGSTFVVTTTADSGSGSFRDAIRDANSTSGLDLVTFAIPGTDVHTITLLSALPAITDPVVIDGATQPGYAGTPLIEINGANAGTGVNGLVIKGGGSTVRALVLNRFKAAAGSPYPTNGMGIMMDVAGGNVIEGCYIGLTADGKDTLGNGGTGIGIFGGSSHNRIGGYGAAARNVISGNKVSGIQVTTGSTGGNRIINNYIGLNAAGDGALGNLGNGIFIDAPDDTVGGAFASARNVISANGEPGIALVAGAQRTLIQGNYFGADAGGANGFGNGYNGVLIFGGSNNTIGGAGTAARNLIYGSDQAGIMIDSVISTGNVIQGNLVGGNLLSLGNTPNTIGIWVRDAPGNTIGGTADSVGNLVTLNATHGIEISGTKASGNVVQGNRIGGWTSAHTGAGNTRYGLVIYNASGNLIGGTAPKARNYIQGNGAGGIIIAGAPAIRNTIQGNSIGPDIDGSSWVGFQTDGIILAASQNLIGGTLPNESNIIAYNKRDGIFDSTGSGNAFLRNLISLNESLGIDLGARGITPNDSLDIDDGANGLQNFPILDSANISTGSVTIKGRMYGTRGARYFLEFFTNDGPCAFHVGQGAKFLGEGYVTCNDSGNGYINVTIAASISIGKFLTATATGPDSSTSEFARELCMLDTDGDGILDRWETPGDGIDWNCDGVIDLDLYRKGARSDHKDVFVEVDHMTGSMPLTQSLHDVEVAFRSVPNKYLNNPDGNSGVNLIVELDAGSVPIAPAAWAADPWAEFLAAKATHFGTDAERASPNAKNVIEAKRAVYRYCIFADTFGDKGNAGKTRLSVPGEPSNDFLVTLGSFGATLNDPDKREMLESGTFMHELGHTLGLRHGGGDSINYKPNYYSVMNYLFNWNVQDAALGVVLPKDTWKLNYSPSALQTLPEANLDESVGLNPQPGDYDVALIPYNRPSGTDALALLKPATAVDWDGNRDSSGFAIGIGDLNYLLPSMKPSPGETLAGYADWPHLKYNFRASPNSLPGSWSPPAPSRKMNASAGNELEDEIGVTEYQQLKQLPPYGIIERKNTWSESSTENTSISVDPTGNQNPMIITDGRRGAIISWHHNQPSTGPVPDMVGVYVQRLDSMGQTHWQNNGVWISPQRGFGLNHAIASDGAGGAIIAWIVRLDPASPSGPFNLYAQRIDSDGVRLWGDAGAGVSTDNTVDGPPMVASDGAGGAIIAWPSTSRNVRAQHVSADGVALWQSGGIALGLPSSFNAFWGDPGSSIAHDPATGTVVIWMTSNSTYTADAVHAQRIDPSGSIRWGLNGLTVSDNSLIASLFPLGGGDVAIAWPDYRVSPPAMYAQRVDTSGAFLWGSTGLPVDVTPKGKSDPQFISDGKGGVILCWWDSRKYPPYRSIYAQRISGAGSLLWPSSMSFADSVSLDGGTVALVGDLKGGALLVYSSNMRSSYLDLFIQHVDSSGSRLWSGGGVAVSTAPYDQNMSVAVGDGVGGVIAAWMDQRFGSSTTRPQYCIFAQLINRTGVLGGSLLTTAGERRTVPAESFRLFQNYPNPFNPSTTVEYDLPSQSKVVVQIYDILGRLVDEVKNEIEPAGHIRLRWNPQNRFASGVYFCRVEVTPIDRGRGVQSAVLKMLLIR